jgi:hypothetical protein
MWPSRAHILKPLTDQSGLKKKAPINWTDKIQKTVAKIHLLMTADALAAYPITINSSTYTLTLLTFS